MLHQAASARVRSHWLMGLCALAGGGRLVAAEFVVWDARLGLEARPTHFTYTLTDRDILVAGTGNQASSSGEDTFDSGYGLGARGLYGFSSPGAVGGWLVGGDLDASQYGYGAGGRYQVLSAHLQGGYGCTFSDRWNGELLAMVGYGLGRFTVPSGDLTSGLAVSGGVLDYGVRLGASYALTRHWLIGLEAGWLVSHGDLRGGGFDLTLDQAGPTVFLGLTYRINPAPVTLE